MREAEREGVRYVDELALSQVRFEGPGVVLEGERRDEAVDVRAGFLIDASGPRGFLAKALGLAEASMRWLPGTQGSTGISRASGAGTPSTRRTRRRRIRLTTPRCTTCFRAAGLGSCASRTA